MELNQTANSSPNLELIVTKPTTSTASTVTPPRGATQNQNGTEGEVLTVEMEYTLILHTEDSLPCYWCISLILVDSYATC